jgi:hypothetical protein
MSPAAPPPGRTSAAARIISSALRRALQIRDRGCRFPGCSNHLFVHAHHIHHWVHGGATTATNLVNVCSTHHRLLHEGGFQVVRGPDGAFLFKDPRGRPIASAPPAREVDADGATTISAWNEAAGLKVDAHTAFPTWDGEPIDYRWVVDGFAAG